MARRFTKGIDLLEAQQKRFAALKMDMRQGHHDLAMQGLQDARELTAAEGPQGKARTQLLAGLGHPLGRGTSAKFSRPNGAARGASLAKRKAHGISGSFDSLPIGIVSGRLNRSMRLKWASGRGIQSFDLTQQDPGGGAYRLLFGGTRKMIGSNFYPEIERRWKARNAAFIQHFVRKQNS